MSNQPIYSFYIEPHYLLHGKYIKSNINTELSKIYSNHRQQDNVFTVNLNFYLYKNNLNEGIIGIFPEKFYNPTINYFDEYKMKVDLKKLEDDFKSFLLIPIKQRMLIDIDEFNSIELKKTLMVLNNRKIKQVLIKFYHTIKTIDENEFFKVFCNDQKLLNDIKKHLEIYNTENFEILIEVLNYFICLYNKENLDYMNLNNDNFYRLINFEDNSFSDKTYKISNSNYLMTNPMVKYVISHLPLKYVKSDIIDTKDEIFIKIDEHNLKKITIRKEEN